MSELSIHDGHWLYELPADADASAIRRYALMATNEIMPIFTSVAEYLDQKQEDSVVLVLPDQAIPPQKTPFQVLHRTLVTVKNHLDKASVAEIAQSGHAQPIPFLAIPVLPHPQALAGMEGLGALRGRTAAQQAQEARGVGFIAITGRMTSKTFGIGYADLYTGVHVLQPIPFLSVLQQVRKTGGRTIAMVENKGGYL